MKRLLPLVRRIRRPRDKEDAPNLSAADLTLAFKYESSDGKNVVVKAARRRRSLAGWKRWRLRSRRRPQARRCAARRAVRPPRTGRDRDGGGRPRGGGGAVRGGARDCSARVHRSAGAGERCSVAARKVGFAVGLYRELLNADPLCAKALKHARTSGAGCGRSLSRISRPLGEDGADDGGPVRAREPPSKSLPRHGVVAREPVELCRRPRNGGRDARGRRLREGARARPHARHSPTTPLPPHLQVLEQDPTHVDALVIRGTPHGGRRASHAAADFEVAIKRDPTSAKAFSARGRLRRIRASRGK